MDDIVLDEAMEDATGGDADLDVIKKSAGKKKGRGFGDSGQTKLDAKPYETLDYTGTSNSGAQRSVEGWIIFVTNIHEEATEDDLKDQLKEHGNLVNLHLNLDRRTGYIKGYALVQYETQQEAADAIAALNGLEFLGQTLKADWCFVKGGRDAKKN